MPSPARTRFERGPGALPVDLPCFGGKRRSRLPVPKHPTGFQPAPATRPVRFP
jgi:hypothetical protein